MVWARNVNASNPAQLNLWAMNLLTGKRETLLKFHQAGTPQYSSGPGPGDHSWSPDGKHLAIYSIDETDETSGTILRLDF